jgi:hypothetical protein
MEGGRGGGGGGTSSSSSLFSTPSLSLDFPVGVAAVLGFLGLRPLLPLPAAWTVLMLRALLLPKPDFKFVFPLFAYFIPGGLMCRTINSNTILVK